jgi:hypothetical protein
MPDAVSGQLPDEVIADRYLWSHCHSSFPG